jgi:hypothetical protein
MEGDEAHDSVHAKYPGRGTKGDSHYLDADSSKDGEADAKRDEYDYWVNVCQAVVTPPKVGLFF